MFDWNKYLFLFLATISSFTTLMHILAQNTGLAILYFFITLSWSVLTVMKFIEEKENDNVPKS